MLGHVDGELLATLHLRDQVAYWIRAITPEVILAHDPWRRYRLHPDHRNAGFLALDGLVAARDPLFFRHHDVAVHRTDDGAAVRGRRARPRRGRERLRRDQGDSPAAHREPVRHHPRDPGGRRRIGRGRLPATDPGPGRRDRVTHRCRRRARSSRRSPSCRPRGDDHHPGPTPGRRRCRRLSHRMGRRHRQGRHDTAPHVDRGDRHTSVRSSSGRGRARSSLSGSTCRWVCPRPELVRATWPHGTGSVPDDRRCSPRRYERRSGASTTPRRCGGAGPSTGGGSPSRRSTSCRRSPSSTRSSTRSLVGAVVEVHPESSFAEIAGAPLLSTKRTAIGRHERRELLAGVVPGCPALLAGHYRGAAPDDVVDAVAVLWSTNRWARGEAIVLGDGAVDRRALPMRIAV